MELNKNDMLRLLSYLEGELQAREVVIATLKVGGTMYSLRSFTTYSASRLIGTPGTLFQGRIFRLFPEGGELIKPVSMIVRPSVHPHCSV